MLGKPIAESSALRIPTATHALGQPELAWRFISGQESRTPMCELGWKSLGVLELTALRSIDEEHWLPMVQERDALLKLRSGAGSLRTASRITPGWTKSGRERTGAVNSY